MITLVFFLEEHSARRFLEGLLPRIFSEHQVTFRFIVFEGKQDLEKQLPRRLRGWRTPQTLFVVLRDQDSADCVDVKQRLVALCRDACHPETLVRVACRALESWYLGDLLAVERALGVSGLTDRQAKQTFRNPDRLGSPSQILTKLTDGRYQKVSGSRPIGPLININGMNRSTSFRVFLDGVQALVRDPRERR